MNVHGVRLEPYTADVHVRGARARPLATAHDDPRQRIGDARVAAFAGYAGALASEVQSTTQAAVR
jgi:hypothetical protein